MLSSVLFSNSLFYFGNATHFNFFSASSAVHDGGAAKLWHWLLLGAIVIALLLFDFFGNASKSHEPTIREAGFWSGLYMAIAAAFGFLIWWEMGLRSATEYWAGWITEWSLSLDNLFVFIIIIAAFRVPRAYQPKVIMIGIVLSMLLRLGFILLGSAIISEFAWVFYLFGLFLIYTAISQAREGITKDEPQEAEEYHENSFAKLIRKVFPVTDGFVGDRLLYRHASKTYLTPMFLVIIAIGSADLMFAFDSIPAIFGLTSHPYIVFAATAFSLMGLRQLYFLVDGLLARLAFLHYGLAVILGFIGIKLIIHAGHEAPLPWFGAWLQRVSEPSIEISMGFIVLVLLLTGISSLLYSRRHQ